MLNEWKMCMIIRIIGLILVCCFYSSLYCQISQIKPGKGIGPIRIGDSIALISSQVEWGKPDQMSSFIDANKVFYTLQYQSKGVTFVYGTTDTSKHGIRKSVLDSIKIISPFYSVEGSAEKVGRGFLKSFGTPDSIVTDTIGKTSTYIYPALGILFITDSTGIITMIAVCKSRLYENKQ